VPKLLMPPVTVETLLMKMPFLPLGTGAPKLPIAEIVPELLMPPEKVETASMTMPFLLIAEIVPELVMPPAKVEIPLICKAVDSAVSKPRLLMPPANREPLETSTPCTPRMVPVPALTIPP
jgi:hypothetical protein